MGKKDHRHEIQAIIELTQKLEHNDIAYFSKAQIPFLTSHSFSDVKMTKKELLFLIHTTKTII